MCFFLFSLPLSLNLSPACSKSFNGSACCIVLIYMTYTMLPLRLRESLIGGMLLSGTHLYSCLTHTRTQYTRQQQQQLDTQLATKELEMEEEEDRQSARLLWQEVSGYVARWRCNCLWLPQIKWGKGADAHLSTGFAAERVNKSRKCATLWAGLGGRG